MIDIPKEHPSEERMKEIIEDIRAGRNCTPLEEVMDKIKDRN